MTLHRCNDNGCPYFEQATTKGCLCHKTDEQVLREQVGDLVTALRRLAGNAGAFRAFEHEIRAVTGHTNWQCLMDAVADADAAVAKVREQGK